ncbi:type I-G CRISPR-associated protein Csb2 [Alicyclobacillus acidocaldarius]|uniref:CRISPR-associated protein, GSU0054 n=1 Tax=Alicyclobacillus acidocaldarius (strain Tc-4-1) TaxID=1048834 RepID=F8IKS2_ALIAT|nr:type I-U CRISPR-associated protein Csb2 [Alicyclobacillus acidocaldarius]AEJ44838.1 conserved hypothetical protein [Alicyclobacillus acidocaldarius subsp. acidocaldarius Tc-4-1]
MVGIEFRFVAGKFHATPWGRHVNEADVEWPPSPWRILRALIGVYYRYSASARYGEAALRQLVEALASEKPMYSLPDAVHTHTKHYMPVAGGRTTLVHDAFLRVEPDAPLGVYWPKVELAEEADALLRHLAPIIPYLGRAESWVEASVAERLPDAFDAVPVEADEAEQMLERAEGELVDLLAPVAPSDWPRLRARWAVGSRKSSLAAAETLFEALLLGTDVLEAERLNLPLGAEHVTYVRRKLDLRHPAPSPRISALRPASNVARFRLVSPVPTRIIHALDVGEAMHAALVGIAAKRGDVPPSLTGKDPENPKEPLREGHRHVFILPTDEDLDGYLDHVLVYQGDPFSDGLVDVLESLRYLYTPDWWPGRPRRWQLYLEGLWRTPPYAERPAEGRSLDVPDGYLRPSRVFTSVTPYLHPWHWKKRGAKFGPADQIREELRRRGLPEPVSVEELGHIRLGGLSYDARKFRKLRYGARQEIPARKGGLWRIEFADPVFGPIALGVNCHFGMGLFYAGEVAHMPLQTVLER